MNCDLYVKVIDRLSWHADRFCIGWLPSQSQRRTTSSADVAKFGEILSSFRINLH